MHQLSSMRDRELKCRFMCELTLGLIVWHISCFSLCILFTGLPVFPSNFSNLFRNPHAQNLATLRMSTSEVGSAGRFVRQCKRGTD
jgi:hypothetical protein